jgi:hypothetical protein
MSAFVAWNEDHGSTFDDGRSVNAYDAESAAKIFAEWDDARSADYLIVGGQDATICVASPDGSNVQRFTVSGEACPVYRARPARAKVQS